MVKTIQFNYILYLKFIPLFRFRKKFMQIIKMFYFLIRIFNNNSLSDSMWIKD